jgi:hypothetical protein
MALHWLESHLMIDSFGIGQKSVTLLCVAEFQIN